ncbi:Gfo/Idh/MocA family oxidoreductase [Paenibacillus sp.]|jgi:predicted dehydrogenase|uniref:Gfo/Idh/MocA family protein n=1 Tax=Paenibacillus sp. TaxID=58172 RepID=UPI0028208164|nr:Gfo/Idh/MocA family oxidoreductase [Paenibacillus sp.]MDR0266977.1 Gfo/Idh/MocA family oxidoreductase [Paenibacillus sp.]
MSVKAIMIGAGIRGAQVYAPYALQHPEQLQFVAIAEPNISRRTAFAEQHHIEPKHVYSDWWDVLSKPAFADVVFICTQDRMHYEVAMQAMKMGYHVLLEKPISPLPEECLEMERAARKYDRLLTICHVLRYTPFWSSIKQIVDKGDIGQIVNIQLRENIGYAHMAHSYVRGNWNQSETSSPIILSKSCHDLDLISWLMRQDCERITSFGSLFHFRKENAPEGAPVYCADGCPYESTCSFVDYRYYLGEGRRRASHFTQELSDEGILRDLRKSPYGRCVYACDNDVVDHQIVNMQFANGATAAFSLSAFTHDSSRIVQITGTRGEIRGDLSKQSFTVFDFSTGKQEEHHAHDEGHEGIDAMIREVCQNISGYSKNTLTSARSSIQSHMIAFAAEESRLNYGKMIELHELVEHYLRCLPPNRSELKRMHTLR